MQSNNPTTGRKSSKPPESASRALDRWAAPGILALATFAVFLPALDNGFVDWDDDKTLSENPHFRGLGWNELRWMFTTFHTGHYQPLSWITFGFDYLVWGMNPAEYHLTSVVLHAANAVLFYFICRRLFLIVFAPRAERRGLAICLAAGLAALLFAVHPLRVESVAWATERRRCRQQSRRHAGPTGATGRSGPTLRTGSSNGCPFGRGSRRAGASSGYAGKARRGDWPLSGSTQDSKGSAKCQRAIRWFKVTNLRTEDRNSER
jgi:hypothetical protein